MKREIFKYLNHISVHPFDVDKLIVSAFIAKNKIRVQNNEFLKSFIIDENEIKDYSRLIKFIAILETEVKHFTAEEVIELLNSLFHLLTELLMELYIRP